MAARTRFLSLLGGGFTALLALMIFTPLGCSGGGGARYQGRVCGSRFSFEGGETNSYDESGTFELLGDNTARKTSTYNDGFCVGRCTDELTRAF